MKMKRYGVNVIETAIQPQEKQRGFTNLESPQGIQQGWNTTLSS